jgi:hypothetical protein
MGSRTVIDDLTLTPQLIRDIERRDGTELDRHDHVHDHVFEYMSLSIQSNAHFPINESSIMSS